jgi:hypothetical protein
VSIYLTYAEGSGRQSDRESSPAVSALLEARCTKSNVSCSCPGDLGYMASDKWLVLDGTVQEISKMINRLASSLNS